MDCRVVDKHMDRGSFIVALITLLLFVAALFTKGFTHDLFLEAGVFLVSIKIIMMAYRHTVALRILDEKVDVILKTLAEHRGESGAGSRSWVEEDEWNRRSEGSRTAKA